MGLAEQVVLHWQQYLSASWLRSYSLGQPNFLYLICLKMKIEHLAIWTHDLERLKAFYQTYFGGQANAKYLNSAKGFASYFLTFGDGGARLELMQRADVPNPDHPAGTELVGLTHFALAVGSPAKVDALTERLRSDGFAVASDPRTTGDGYYESVVLDPDGNRLELVA